MVCISTRSFFGFCITSLHSFSYYFPKGITSEVLPLRRAQGQGGRKKVEEVLGFELNPKLGRIGSAEMDREGSVDHK